MVLFFCYISPATLPHPYPSNAQGFESARSARARRRPRLTIFAFSLTGKVRKELNGESINQSGIPARNWKFIASLTVARVPTPLDMSSVSSIIWASSLPDHCTPTSPFLLNISSVFNTCIPTPLAFLSSLLGLLSIGAWLFALPPQLYKNFALSSASGLSVYFLMVWFLGDLANMLGALFTEQAAWQVVVATYFVMVDVILCGQYIWYERLRSWRQKHQAEAKPLIEEDGDYDNAEGPSEGISVSDEMEEISEDGRQDQPVNGAASSGSMAKGGKAFTSRHNSDNKSAKTLQSSPANQKAQKPTSYLTEKPKITRIKPSALPLAPSQQTLLLLSILCAVLANASPLSPTITTAPPLNPPTTTPIEFAGRILSWLSSLLYLGSRIPQIYKNYNRRSTSGLSPSLFIAAFTGNFFYSTSVVTNPLAWSSTPPWGLHGWAGPEGSDRGNWISLAAPFWLGTAGVLVLDATIGVQFLTYGEGKVKVVREARPGGRGRWRRVEGWMRGWVPSPGPTEGERGRLLEVNGQGGYGGA